ncbi:MAG TPA: hypothetical protein EYN66_14335 [Myxococcales bacterium]|nr:hypothetical protein [Myxococcales bacterium]
MSTFDRIVSGFGSFLIIVGSLGCASVGSDVESNQDSDLSDGATATSDTGTTERELSDTSDDVKPEDTITEPAQDIQMESDTPEIEAPQQDTQAPGKYKGGWPENPKKDTIPDPGWADEVGVGKTLPHYIAMDQHGDMVDLYDFAGTGKLIVLDVGTWYCKPCKGMASYFSTGDPSSMDDYPWWNESYEIVKTLVDNGDIHWITVLYSLGTPVYDDVLKWEEAFPSKDIPVLADSDLQLKEYLQVKAMPHIAILDSDMKFLLWSVNGPTQGMKYLVEFAKGL